MCFTHFDHFDIYSKIYLQVPSKNSIAFLLLRLFLAFFCVQMFCMQQLYTYVNVRYFLRLCLCIHIAVCVCICKCIELNDEPD